MRPGRPRSKTASSPCPPCLRGEPVGYSGSRSPCDNRISRSTSRTPRAVRNLRPISGARRRSPSVSSQPASVSGGNSRMTSAKARKIASTSRASSRRPLATPPSARPRGSPPRPASLSEQRQLVALLRRWTEAAAVERMRYARGEAEPAAGAVEARGEHLGVRSAAGHPLRPGRIIEPAAMALRDQRQDVSGLLRGMLLQPFPEQRLQFERQPQERVAGDAGPGFARLLEDRLHLAVVERGDHRRRQNSGRHAGCGERGDRFEPALRGGGARLHMARQIAVERRHRDRDDRKLVARHLAEDVEIALDQRPFCDDRDRMAEIAQHLEDRPGDAEPLFGRLIRVGVAAERERPAAIVLLAQLGAEQRRRLRLIEDAGLEIEAGRQPEIGVARPRVTINAAMLAAAIGVDRAVEADIGRVVARNDRAGRIYAEDRRDPARPALQLTLDRAPAVIKGDPPLALEAAGLVADGAASLARHDAARHIHAGHYAGSMRTIQEHNLVSVVIPTLDAAADLTATLAALGNARLIRE